MSFRPLVICSIVLLGLTASPAVALDKEVGQNLQVSILTTQGRQSSDQQTKQSSVRVLSDHPGSATALTPRQKQEIRDFVTNAQGRKTLICTAASLAGQRESMYRVVRIRAELVCDFALSLDSSLTTTVQEKTTRARQYNGRVVVVVK